MAIRFSASSPAAAIRSTGPQKARREEQAIGFHPLGRGRCKPARMASRIAFLSAWPHATRQAGDFFDGLQLSAPTAFWRLEAAAWARASGTCPRGPIPGWRVGSQCDWHEWREDKADSGAGVEREDRLKAGLPTCCDFVRSPAFRRSGLIFTPFVTGTMAHRHNGAHSMAHIPSRGLLRPREGTGLGLGIGFVSQNRFYPADPQVQVGHPSEAEGLSSYATVSLQCSGYGSVWFMAL